MTEESLSNILKYKKMGRNFKETFELWSVFDGCAGVIMSLKIWHGRLVILVETWTKHNILTLQLVSKLSILWFFHFSDHHYFLGGGGEFPLNWIFYVLGYTDLIENCSFVSSHLHQLTSLALYPNMRWNWPVEKPLSVMKLYKPEIEEATYLSSR